MKNVTKAFLVIVSVVFLGYLLLPNPGFPLPPPDSIQSKEPADTETSLRRAYFTNYSRQEVMDWYKSQFKWGEDLNYPPETSQTIIRDQTRSTFLEEIVHPLRESIYVNGFEPAELKDAIFIEDRPWRQKIIIRYVPSPVFIRVAVFAGTAASALVLFGAWKKSVKDIE